MAINQSSMFDKVEMMRRQTEQIEADRQAEIKAKAEKNRRRMPIIAALVDLCKEISGSDVKVIFASENGSVVGSPGQEGMPLTEINVGHYKREKKK